MTIASVKSSAASAFVSASASLSHPFARVDTYGDFESARAAWRELGALGAGAYQTQAFARAWIATVGARNTPLIVVARDGAGRPIALLPLCRRRFGPLNVARFIGGAWANYQFGLFPLALAWSADDIRTLLQEAGRQAGVDLFMFSHQPLHWEGVANPLTLLPGRRSPNTAFATALRGSHEDWFEAHFSRSTQKKMRKKTRKLEALGPVQRRRAESSEEAARYLMALLAHRSAQAEARGEPNAFDKPHVGEFLRRLALNAAPSLEMHALLVGERIAAVFGAMPGGRRLSGLIVSYDGDPEIAAATPGELLLSEVARDAIARGFETLDLGVGASRYKGAICEIEEPLVDSSFGVTWLGRLAAPGFLLWRSMFGEMKRRPRLLRFAKRVRQVFGD